MSCQPVSDRTSGPSPWAGLLLSRALWGGVALVAIWLSVLFVGVFGGDIVKTNADGSSSSVPVVVVVAIVALLATMSVGRWAFRSEPGNEELRRSVEDERRALERITAQLSQTSAKPSS